MGSLSKPKAKCQFHFNLSAFIDCKADGVFWSPFTLVRGRRHLYPFTASKHALVDFVVVDTEREKERDTIKKRRHLAT